MTKRNAAGPIEQNKVFISSVMNTSVEDLTTARSAVHEGVCGYDFLIPWSFERTPASSEDLGQSYLRPVEECDLFILIIGAEVTDPVIEECLRAKELDKHILVFVKRVDRQSPAARLLLKQIDKKYATFSSTDELKHQVKEAIDQLSALSLRSPRQQTSPRSILSQISKFIGTDTRFRVTPIVPRTASGDSFLLREANSETVTLYKLGPQETVTLPTNRVTEILHGESQSQKVLVLNGRLQHITTKWQWSFFEEKPDPNSEFGFVKASGLHDPEVVDITTRLQGRFDFYWNAASDVGRLLQSQWVICYGDGGRCFYIKDAVRDLILMARRRG